MEVVSQGIRRAYFDPVAMIVSLLRRDESRVEVFGWMLDTVKADKIPLVTASNTKREWIFMTE